MMTDNDLTMGPPEKPAILPWFTTFCMLLVVCCLLLVVIGVLLLVLPAETMQATSEDIIILRIEGIFFIVAGIPMAAAYAAAPFLPRRPWVWVVNLILICLCLTSICCMPFGIPLLIYWLKEETQVYYGRALKARTMMS